MLLPFRLPAKRENMLIAVLTGPRNSLTFGLRLRILNLTMGV